MNQNSISRKKFPLISIIIPVYNMEKYLCECVDSVIAQTYANLEIILIDDGSTDNSAKICAEYEKKDGRIKVIYQQNAGVSVARNAGLRIAKGEYIGFVDADDYIAPDMYQYLLTLAIEYHCDIAICSVFGEPNLIKTNQPLVCPYLSALYQLYEQSYIHNKLFHHRIINNIHFQQDIAICEDLVFCFQTFRKAKQVVYGPVPKYHYVTHPQSASHSSVFSNKKLSVFKATAFLETHTTPKEWNVLNKRVSQTNAYVAAGLLRRMIDNNIDNPQITNYLLSMLRKNLWIHLSSHHKLSNKLFALVCSLNFQLAAMIYRKIGRRL